MHPSRAGLAEVLAVPDYRRLLRVRCVGQAGDGVFQTALFSAVFFNPESATSAAQAASAFAVLLLPYSLVGPFAGVLLDRWSRQRVLVLANLLRALLVLGFAGLVTADGATSVVVQSLSLVVISVSRFVLSCLSAAQPHVVAPDRLVVAQSASTTLGGGFAIAGGGLAVALSSLLGDGDRGAARTAVVALVLYAAAAALAARLPRALLGPDHPPAEHWRSAAGAVLRGVGEGARHVAAIGPAARGLAAVTAHRFAFGLAFVATLLLYTDEGAIGRGVGGIVAVVVASGAGGLAAAVLTPLAVRRLGAARWVTLLLALAAVVQAAALTFAHPAYVVAAVLLGLSAQGTKITVDALLQETVDDDHRGRVFSFYDTAFNVSFVAAAGVAALLLPDDGRSPLVVGLCVAAYALTALAHGTATRAARRREELSRSG